MAAQPDQLKVKLSNPQNGWIELQVRTTEEEFKAVVSYTPNDFILELSTALSLAIQGANGEAVAYCEPTTYAITFSPARNMDALLFQIVRYPDWQRSTRSACSVMSIQGTILNVVVPFWRALRLLDGEFTADEYREAMRRDFPSRCLQRLSKLVAEERSPRIS